MKAHDPERETAERLAEALEWPFVDLEDYSISCGVLRKVSAELACRLRAVPMVFNSRRVVVVVDDPFQGFYVALHPELFVSPNCGPPYRRGVEVAMATRRGLDAALHRRITLVKD